LFWENKKRPLNIAPIGDGSGIPFMYQSMDALCKEPPGLLLEALHHHDLDIFVTPNLQNDFV
jgi:hypothetical protein